MMTSHNKEKLRADLLKAIDKVICTHIDMGATFESIILPESLPEILTNAIMLNIAILDEYHNDLRNAGYLTE